MSLYYLDSKVLELGCGTGNLLKSVNPSYAVGVDISKEIIKEAKKEHKEIKFFHGDISKLSSILDRNEKI